MMTSSTIGGRFDFLTGQAGSAAFPVAFDAPTHREVFDLPHAIHSLHRAMASLTGQTGMNVRSMIETGKGRQIVNSDPLDRFGLLVWVWLELFDVESKCIVELLQIGGNDSLGDAFRFSCLKDFG